MVLICPLLPQCGARWPVRKTFLQEVSQPLQVLRMIPLPNVVMRRSFHPPMAFRTGVAVMKRLCLAEWNQFVVLRMTKEDRHIQTVETVDRIHGRSPEIAV